MTKLHTHLLDADDALVSPEQIAPLTPESRATAFFSDFRQAEPRVVEGSMLATDARRLLAAAHERLRLVVNKQGEFIGLIDVRHLTEQNILRHLLADKTHRDELVVADLMTPRRQLLALSRLEAEKASIGQVIECLQEAAQPYCLIVDDEAHHIRGVFSLYEIARVLHTPEVIRSPVSLARAFAVAS